MYINYQVAICNTRVLAYKGNEVGYSHESLHKIAVKDGKQNCSNYKYKYSLLQLFEKAELRRWQ